MMGFALPRPYVFVPVALALLSALAPAPSAAQHRADSAALVTVLGRDTLALERWVRSADRVTADVVVRSPRTTLRRYVLDLGPGGTMRRFEERTFDPVAPDRPIRTERLEARGERWVRTVVDAERTRSDTVQAPGTALPFVDLVHWPFELMLMRAGRDRTLNQTTTQPLLAGGRMLPFTARWSAPNTVEFTHPLRGTMSARTDAAGRLLSLDAAGTTRKVRASRVPWLQLENHARVWAAADASGRSVGELSGRAQEEKVVAGARLSIDYGTPYKRGRGIWGNVVPWGEVWRTGANRATHFSVDRQLVFGNPATGTLVVPAGTYTLFSVPGADGGVLIVNKQTGQNGTAYDPKQDLGRVRMRRAELPTTVERFTIRVDSQGASGGVLRLQWDQTELSVPFAAR